MESWKNSESKYQKTKSVFCLVRTIAVLELYIDLQSKARAIARVEKLRIVSRPCYHDTGCTHARHPGHPAAYSTVSKMDLNQKSSP